MTKKLSFVSLIAVLLFIGTNFCFSNFESYYLQGARLGWPLLFFSAEPEKQLMATKYFSLINFTIDFLIFTSIAILLVLLKTAGKKNKRHLA